MTDSFTFTTTLLDQLTIFPSTRYDMQLQKASMSIFLNPRDARNLAKWYALTFPISLVKGLIIRPLMIDSHASTHKMVQLGCNAVDLSFEISLLVLIKPQHRCLAS